MDMCIIHGRHHDDGETDTVHLVGDDFECRTEEWPVVPGEVVEVHTCEPSDAPVYPVTTGTLAYLDTIRGLVPVKVLNLEGYEADVRVTANRPGYTKGEKFPVHVPNGRLVNRHQVTSRSGIYYINGSTTFIGNDGGAV